MTLGTHGASGSWVRSYLLAIVATLAVSVPHGGPVWAAGSRAGASRVKPQSKPTRNRQVQQVRTGKPTKPDGPTRMTRAQANQFLRTPKGQAKFQKYKQRALDSATSRLDPHGSRPVTAMATPRARMSISRARAKIITGFTVVASAVTGLMGGIFGGTIGALSGGGPTGAEMLASGAHPATHFFNSGQFVTGAIVGVGVTLVGGLTAAYGFRKNAKNIERRAEGEAMAQLFQDLGVRD